MVEVGGGGQLSRHGRENAVGKVVVGRADDLDLVGARKLVDGFEELDRGAIVHGRGPASRCDGLGVRRFRRLRGARAWKASVARSCASGAADLTSRVLAQMRTQAAQAAFGAGSRGY